MAKEILSAWIPVTDCDQINARLLEKDQAGYAALNDAGLLCTDEEGNVDRTAMADQMFDHPGQRKKMEAILHPLIIEELKQWIDAQTSLCAAEVPLLFECSLQNLFDEVWTITCSDQTALDRLGKYRHIPAEEARRRLALQFPAEKKMAQSTHVLPNDGTKEELAAQIGALLPDSVRLACSFTQDQPASAPNLAKPANPGKTNAKAGEIK